MTEILLVSTSSKHSLTHNFLLSKFLLKSLFTKGPPTHTQNVYWFLNFKSFFLEFSFPNKLPTLCLPLKCQAVTQNTKATGLVLPGCGCNARCRRAELTRVRWPWSPAQVEAAGPGPRWKSQGHRGGKCQEAREKLCEQLILPNPQSREKRANQRLARMETESQ